MNNDPIQSLVQSYLLPSLEATARRLEMLNESQHTLLHQLSTIQTALEEIGSVQYNTDKKDVLAKITSTRAKLARTASLLETAHSRINKIQKSHASIVDP